MAYAQTSPTQEDIRIFQADKEADITDLPTDVGIGSQCVVVETFNIYLLNTDKEWKLAGGGA